MMYLDMDGTEIKVGDYVAFKDDIETSGKVSGFSRGLVQVKVWHEDLHDFDTHMVSPKRCWHE